MKTTFLICLIITAIGFYFTFPYLKETKEMKEDHKMYLKAKEYLANRYPDPDDLPVVNGVIKHPVYGEYPENVSFSQGMSLMPGQSAGFNIVIELEEEL